MYLIRAPVKVFLIVKLYNLIMYILCRLDGYFIKRTNHEQAEVYHTFMDFLWRFYVDFVDIVKVLTWTL